MWKPEHRRAADRSWLRYPSDLTDAEWSIVEPMIPPARHGGRRRSVNVREVLNGISTCCGLAANGRLCPRTCRPKARFTTILSSGIGMARWSVSITNCMSRCASRKAEKRARQLRLSTRRLRRARKKGGLARSSGYDAGKKIKGRKRHILVDTLGLLLNVVVLPPMSRTGMVLSTCCAARRLFPFIERIFADGGYAGRKMALTVWRTGAWKLQIVKRSDAAGFEVLPKRWIVERTFAWISRNRRLARDFERYATTVVAFIRLAMIRIMLRQLAANTSSLI